mgnify:FL=1
MTRNSEQTLGSSWKTGWSGLAWALANPANQSLTSRYPHRTLSAPLTYLLSALLAIFTP